MASEYGYKTIRPQLSVTVMPCKPASAIPRYLRNVCVAVLIVGAIMAAARDPQRFATGFVVGFTASRIVAH